MAATSLHEFPMTWLGRMGRSRVKRKKLGFHPPTHRSSPSGPIHPSSFIHSFIRRLTDGRHLGSDWEGCRLMMDSTDLDGWTACTLTFS